MPSWLWLAGGLGLMFLELATPSGFFVMFFGLGALTVGILAAFGVMDTAWVQWLVFTLASVLYLLLFRGPLQRRFYQPAPAVDALVGELVIPRERIEPGSVGRVDLRGALWNARNESSSTVDHGQRCRVTRVDGLLVFIQPE